MLSIGMAVCGVLMSGKFAPVEPTTQTFYRELKPISEAFIVDAVLVSKLDRERLREVGTAPSQAMRDAADWIRKVSLGNDPVAVGYPIVFDWMFLHWYFVTFEGSSPFGYSQALDMKTMYQAHSHVAMRDASKSSLPDNLKSFSAQSHHALEDAIDQGRIFQRLVMLGSSVGRGGV